MRWLYHVTVMAAEIKMTTATTDEGCCKGLLLNKHLTPFSDQVDTEITTLLIVRWGGVWCVTIDR